MDRSDLSPDQLQVYSRMLDWVRSSSRLLTVGGYAGTGKSTLLGLLAQELCKTHKIAFVCYTGRASSIVQRKLAASNVETTNMSCTEDDRKLTGSWHHMFYGPRSPEAKKPFCGTIHRLLYRPFIDSVTEELMGWEKRPELDRKYDLIIIDEASMVPASVVEDIQVHGARIIAVGDHGQLPPVMGDGTLMQNPMLRLEKIHRQAEDSPIIQLSRIIREEGRMAQELADGERLKFVPKSSIVHPSLATMLSRERLDAAVLCWRNATRVHVNRTVRGHLQFSGKGPQVGEPLVALRNYSPIYNGMRGLVTEEANQPYKEYWLMRVALEFPDEGIPSAGYDICRDQFHRARPFESVDELKKHGMTVYAMSGAGNLFDFAYAMTVHKSQGSQFKHAVVVADWRPNYRDQENTRRLAYTAVTRAQSKLTVVQ